MANGGDFFEHIDFDAVDLDCHRLSFDGDRRQVRLA